ncbi:hypothetical protein BV20DRAFT_752634 [Pilatotrama ljubarskyi]|nr:hypothetical protein BV20DRAFT_752634 [Pilatotrama ljubarskyi]
MEHCRLPIEVCEHIIEAFSPDVSPIWDRPSPFCNVVEAPGHVALSTLCACALTCCAWRFRAQFILWRHPWITDNEGVMAFTAVLRCTSPSSALHISSLRLDGPWKEDVSLSQSGNFFLLSLPNLRHLRLSRLYLDATKAATPPRLRNRLVLCASIIHLELFFCRFDRPRTMFDIIWSCPHLRSLKIVSCSHPPAKSQDELARLVQASMNPKACQNLTRLQV